MKKAILSYLNFPCDAPVHWFDSIDSTNTYAKALAQAGAKHGTAVVAGMQTGGRGRMGRQFSSPQGLGAYVSVILRPRCPAEKLLHLTCAAAVAACQAVENASGLRTGIKWTNDLVVEKRKLGGILTELGIDAEGNVDYAVIGVGVNCLQQLSDFPAEIQGLATSLTMACGQNVSPALVSACLIDGLRSMSLGEKEKMLAVYKERCITLHHDVVVLRGDEKRYAKALDIDESGGLLVEFSDGTCACVASGEVSVRGMYGYI